MFLSRTDRSFDLLLPSFLPFGDGLKKESMVFFVDENKRWTEKEPAARITSRAIIP